MTLHPDDGLSADDPEMERTMMQRLFDGAIAVFLIGGAGGGWIALVRVAVWGW